MTLKPPKIENLLFRVCECVSLGRYRDTSHSIERKQQRNIFITDIIHVLTTGRHEKSKDRFDPIYKEWSYAIRGLTLDKKDLRIIVSFDVDRDLLIITAFYIERR